MIDRLAVRDRALSLSGRCACAKRRAAFVDAMPPAPKGGWDPILSKRFRQWHDEAGKLHTEGISICALTLYQIWLPFITMPELWYKPYEGGAFVREKALAHMHGAWHDAADLGKGLLPAPGDAVWTPGHVQTVVELVDPYDLIDVVEGGHECWTAGSDHEQRGLQAIVHTPAKAWSTRDRTIGGVKLDGWIDITKMPPRS